MKGESGEFRQLVAQLSHDGTPRVWSLIVTIFGDLARDSGLSLSGTALSRMTARVDVRAEATRVALHRLRRDGWIETRRTGRESAYSLTAFGRAQSRAAAPAIYDAPRLPDSWHLVVAGPGAGGFPDSAGDDLLVIDDRLALAPGPAPQGGADALRTELRSQDLPRWVSSALFPDELCASVRQFDAALDAVMPLVPEARDWAVLDAVMLRVLIVHGWRRIALRLPAVPDSFAPKGWRGDACRRKVHGILERLDRRPIEQIERAARMGARR